MKGAIRLAPDRELAAVVDPAITRTIHSAASGRDFLVRIVRKGDRYGLLDCVRHDEDEPMVEFYDLTHASDDLDRFGPRGQFVSRYYLDTLLDREHGRGLLLHGSEPAAWTLDGRALCRAIAFALDVVDR